MAQYNVPKHAGSKIWTPEIEEEVDYQFIQRVQNEVTQSCALPFAVPAERIPEYIVQAAQWFWANVDQSVEERAYAIKKEDICKGNVINKIIQLPPQIMGVFGCYRLQEQLKYAAMGDFSIERMMLSSYSMFGGAGIIGGGLGLTGGTGYTLSDVMMSLYEIDTFDQMLNPPLTYNFNEYSSKLVLLGDVGYSDILVQCMVRCRIQDLYNSYYFFRLVVCFCKRALNNIVGIWDFKYPGNVTLNIDKLVDQANDEIEEIKEWAERNRTCDYFFQPNQV